MERFAFGTMFGPGEIKTAICEQCGAPLTSPPGEEGCLNCLLTSGIGTDDVEEASSLDESGNRFYQHYEILTRADGSCWELGRGAMGVTYKARDINLDMPVALKIINARFSARPDARRRFLHEAQAAARLRHPNVASVFHFGTINTVPTSGGAATTAEENADAGDCFTRCEFVEGETLEGRLRLGWQWDPLRNDPRFQEILATPEPQTIFLVQLIKREQFASETFPF